MSLALALLLGLMLAAALGLTLLPLSQPVRDPYAAGRAELTAQRDQLYAALDALPDLPETDAERLRLEGQAARVLQRLDELPTQPPAEESQGQTAHLARLGWGAALGLTLLAALTFIPAWQRAGLGAADAAKVAAAQQLPRLRTAAQRSPSTASYNAWGDAAFDQDNYREAMQAYTESLKLEPRQPQPLRRLGTLLLNRESFGGPPLEGQEAGQAFSLIALAAQLAPQDAESQLLLGYALARFGQDDAALTALERYRTLNPSGRDADEVITSIRSAQNSAGPGLAVYTASCASCHGPAGNGGLGPSLRASTLSREAAAQVITEGKGGMPAVQLSKADLSAVLDVLQEWQGRASSSAASTSAASASPLAPALPNGRNNSGNNESAGSLQGDGLQTPSGEGQR